MKAIKEINLTLVLDIDGETTKSELEAAIEERLLALIPVRRDDDPIELKEADVYVSDFKYEIK